jgi:hypothetical protein
MKVATKRSVEKQKAGVTPKKIADTYQLKVTLDGIEPPIWRRLLVPGDINLVKLHEVLQVAMGWTNSHLHQFIVGDTYYVIPDEDFEGSSESKDERRYTLAQLAKRKGANVVYEYDFGDGWEHLIAVEEVRAADAKTVQAQCLDGARACPPEDVGSIPGYDHFLKAIKNPKHPEHEEMLEWIGGRFDPEAFSVAGANEDLKNWRKHGLFSFE